MLQYSRRKMRLTQRRFFASLSCSQLWRSICLLLVCGTLRPVLGGARTSTFIDEVSLRRCLANLHAADTDDNQELSPAEFVDFLYLESYGKIDGTAFTDIPINMVLIYYFVACLCSQDGGGPNCCVGGNAEIDLARKNGRPLYTKTFCSLVELGIYDTLNPTPPPSPFASASPTTAPNPYVTPTTNPPSQQPISLSPSRQPLSIPPSPKPTTELTQNPSKSPSSPPTFVSTSFPTESPTSATIKPSRPLTEMPTSATPNPTRVITGVPTKVGTVSQPPVLPTPAPSAGTPTPTVFTAVPTFQFSPTHEPSSLVTPSPITVTGSPTSLPTPGPSQATLAPSTSTFPPSSPPTLSPLTSVPSNPTIAPTSGQTQATPAPTPKTVAPTPTPKTVAPTPTPPPTQEPSQASPPTILPSSAPTPLPTSLPPSPTPTQITASPSFAPVISPSVAPSTPPTLIPPTPQPTIRGLRCVNFQYGLQNQAGLDANAIFNMVNNTLRTGLIIATRNITIGILNASFPRTLNLTARTQADASKTVFEKFLRWMEPNGKHFNQGDRRILKGDSKVVEVAMENALADLYPKVNAKHLLRTQIEGMCRRRALTEEIAVDSNQGRRSRELFASRRLVFFSDAVPVTINAIFDNPVCTNTTPPTLCSVVSTTVCVFLESGDNATVVVETLLMGFQLAVNTGKLQQAIPPENQV